MWKKLQLDRFLVIDLEATCWDIRDFETQEQHREYQRVNREIIEIGVTEISFVEKKLYQVGITILNRKGLKSQSFALI